MLEGAKEVLCKVIHFFSVTKLGIITVWFPQTPDQSVIVCPRWMHYIGKRSAYYTKGQAAWFR